MRFTAFVGLAGLLCASQATAADPAVYRAVVTDPEVKFRAGPSDAFPETGSLKRGSAVIVEREESNGWLAITAPSGSVSWIAYSFVEDLSPDRQTPKNGLVHAEGEVTIAVGKAGDNQLLDVRREKLPQGTIVLLIGPPTDFSGKKWWPIAPPAGDVRYLPKSAVQIEKPVNNTVAVRVTDTGAIPPAATPVTPSGGPLATVPGPGSSPPPPGGVTASKPAVNHPLWIQAETAEREGRLADAEKTYFELAALMNAQGGDHDIANLCYTRIHAIREKKRNASGLKTSAPTPNTTPATPATPNVLQPPSKSGRGVRPGAPQALPTGSGTNAGTNTGTGTNATATDAQWSGPGLLRRTAVTPDGTGSPAYALETSPGVVKVYVIAGPGVRLEQYLGKTIDVYGTPQTRPKLSKPYVVATAVEPAQ